MKTRALSPLSDTESAAITAYVQAIQKQYPDRIQAVALFGSKARGDDDPESDIDLLVICDFEDRQFCSALWRKASEISLEQSVLISVRIYSQERWLRARQIGLPFTSKIISDSVPLTPEPIPN
jgi:predicted nucleotidyltransferase